MLIHGPDPLIKELPLEVGLPVHSQGLLVNHVIYIFTDFQNIPPWPFAGHHPGNNG